MTFVDLPDLAARKWGSAVLYANDDFFAEKDNLLKPEAPVFIEGKYTDRGKWMDGWESRRRRVSGHDFCIVRLGLPGCIAGIVVDTAFFRGNFPKACSIDGVSMPGQPTVEELLHADTPWTELLASQDLQGDHKNLFEFSEKAKALRVTHLRFHIYPDGGVARLRVFGEVVPTPRFLGKNVSPAQEVDLAALEHGASVVACNDMFFGSRHNLIGPGRAANMGDGWETKRSRREGPDWAILKLAARGTLHRALLDTLHFKGNFPESAALHVADVPDGTDVATLAESAWTEILPRSKLQAHTLHDYEREIASHSPGTHVRLRIWPDGGVSRLRLFGIATPEAQEHCALRYFHTLGSAARTALFLECCASATFAKSLTHAGPLAGVDAWMTAAERTMNAMNDADWNEAFAGHPRIGESKSGAAAAVAMAEQARVADANLETRSALAQANAAYEAKFGRIYLVCATGKTASEMLALCEARMRNEPAAELAIAKGEQRKITLRRLAKLWRRA
jgi:allantoicase